MPLVGVLLPGARAAARATRTKRVGVIGTTATIRSGGYEDALCELDPAIKIWSRACPLFVPLVEEGWHEDEITRLTAKRYLDSDGGFRRRYARSRLHALSPHQERHIDASSGRR